ncbi:DUF4402 domain-containing protein [Thalassospiraceae bacterium LMO-JJ14]|nr:DUF4402 domain-containing protein [Thalassospiraceae bacterium LMO-JJ14]
MLTKSLGKKRSWIRAACLAVAFCVFAPGPATTQVAITLVPKRNMKFGEFAASIDGGGTVVLSPDADSVSWSGAITNFGGTVKRARFQIVGEPKAYVIVSLPSSITIRKGTSNNYMTIDNFTMDKTNPVKLSKDGKKTINIGATLHISTDQTKGNYNDENTFTYIVEYL